MKKREALGAPPGASALCGGPEIPSRAARTQAGVDPCHPAPMRSAGPRARRSTRRRVALAAGGFYLVKDDVAGSKYLAIDRGPLLDAVKKLSVSDLSQDCQANKPLDVSTGKEEYAAALV